MSLSIPSVRRSEEDGDGNTISALLLLLLWHIIYECGFLTKQRLRRGNEGGGGQPKLGVHKTGRRGRKVRDKYAASFLARRPSRLIAAVFANAAAAPDVRIGDESIYSSKYLCENGEISNYVVNETFSRLDHFQIG